MKTKVILSAMMVLLIIPAACKPAANTEPEVGKVVEAAAEIGNESDSVSTGICPDPTAENHALTFAAQGICFLSPEQYDVSKAEDNSNLSLYVISPQNTEAPFMSMSFEAANGRTLSEVTEQFLADYATPDTEPQEISLGGEMAYLVDNLPGQDTNRRVLTIHDGIVYNLMIARIGPDYGDVGEEAELLFSQVIGTFQFIPIEPDAPLATGVK